MNTSSLTRSQFIQLKHLLDKGCRLQHIALMLDVSLPDIKTAVANQEWSQYVPVDPKSDRCPDCGGLVLDDTQPCMVCEQRREMAIQKAIKEYKALIS